MSGESTLLFNQCIWHRHILNWFTFSRTDAACLHRKNLSLELTFRYTGRFRSLYAPIRTTSVWSGKRFKSLCAHTRAHPDTDTSHVCHLGAYAQRDFGIASHFKHLFLEFHRDLWITLYIDCTVLCTKEKLVQWIALCKALCKPNILFSKLSKAIFDDEKVCFIFAVWSHTLKNMPN